MGYRKMINVVWFKRDLRVHDNEALTSAAKDGPVLPLYIYEPSLWEQEEMSFTKRAFLRVSLEELNLALKELGQGLIIKKGNAVDILDNLNTKNMVNMDITELNFELGNDEEQQKTMKNVRYLFEKFL